MAKITDARAKTTVRTGFLKPSHWFNFHPPNVPTNIMASIVKPKPEYLAKKRSESPLVLFLSFNKAWFFVC